MKKINFNDDENYDDDNFDNDNYDEFENDDLDEELKKFSVSEDTKINVSQLLQKINRILAEDEQIVTKSGRFGAIGTTDIKNSIIYLDYDDIKKYTKNDLAKFLTLTKGINYHELAHILFTNISQDKIEKFILNKGSDSGNYYDMDDFFNVFNLLEDCRIENLFCSEYERAKYYFSFAAISILFEKRNEKSGSNLSNYLLLFGRKFLQTDLSKLRNSLKIEAKIISKSEKIVDEFIVEQDIEKRLELTFDLMKLLISNKQFINKNVLSNLSSIDTSRKLKKGEKIRQATEKMKKILKNLEKNKQKSIPEDEDEIENEGEQKSKSEKNTEENSNAGYVKTKTITEKVQEKIDASKIEGEILEKVKKQVENSLINIEREISKDIETLKAVLSKDEFTSYDGEVFRPSDVEKLEAKKVENVLRTLRSDLTTQIHKFRKSGKFDIQSAIKSEKENTLKAFAKHEMNKVDKSRLGISILLDTSGSIQDDDFKKEVSATWCLSEAFKKLNNKVEVLEFSNTHFVLKNFNSEGDWKRHFRGGTNVVKPLQIANKDLTKLKKVQNIQNLIAIIVSDGQFDDSEKAILEVQKLKKLGITTVWILVNKNEYGLNENFSRNVDVFIHLKDFNRLSNEIKRLVIKLQRNINNRLMNNTFYSYSSSLELKGVENSKKFSFSSCLKLDDSFSKGGKLNGN